MGSFIKTPKAPAPVAEDPAVTALRNQEQQRAEQDRIRATQKQLGIETRLRSRSNSTSLLGAFALGGNRIRSLLGAG